MKQNNFLKSFAAVTLFSIGSIFAQDNFETWPLTSFSVQDGGIDIEQENTIVNEGNSSAKITVNTGNQGNTDWRQSVTLKGGVTYTISLDVYHTNNSLKVRIYAGTYRNYSDNTVAGGWQTISYDITPDTDGNYEIGFRFYDQAGFSGSEVVYVDNFKVIDPTTSTPIVWTGNTNDDWNTESNWENDKVPGNGDEVIIPSGVTNYPFATSGRFMPAPKKITIESGATAIFETFGWDNTEVIFKREIKDTNWHLITSPLDGVDVDDFVTENGLAKGQGNNIALGNYINTGEDNIKKWSYYQEGTTGTGNFVIGQGHSVKVDAPKELVFRGKLFQLEVDYQTPVNLNGDKFSLVGSPYTAYLDVKKMFNSFTNLFEEKTVWVWNGTEYIAKNETEDVKIAPAQGFFVKATNISIYPAMLVNQSEDNFLKTEPKTNIELTVTSNNKATSTKVFYINGKTNGFDNGFDSSIFGGITPELKVYTALVDNTNRKLDIQTVSDNNIEETIIPVGVIGKNKEVVFSTKSVNLPNGIEVYLEDTAKGIFTNLSKENYKAILTDNNNNRFYLHTTSKRLGLENITTNSNNIVINYNANASTINVVGLQNEKATIKIYSITGKTVLSANVKNNELVTLPSLTTGVYIVKVSSKLGDITKKIILK